MIEDTVKVIKKNTNQKKILGWLKMKESEMTCDSEKVEEESDQKEEFEAVHSNGLEDPAIRGKK